MKIYDLGMAAMTRSKHTPHSDVIGGDVIGDTSAMLAALGNVQAAVNNSVSVLRAVVQNPSQSSAKSAAQTIAPDFNVVASARSIFQAGPTAPSFQRLDKAFQAASPNLLGLAAALRDGYPSPYTFVNNIALSSADMANSLSALQKVVSSLGAAQLVKNKPPQTKSKVPVRRGGFAASRLHGSVDDDVMATSKKLFVGSVIAAGAVGAIYYKKHRVLGGVLGAVLGLGVGSVVTLGYGLKHGRRSA